MAPGKRPPPKDIILEIYAALLQKTWRDSPDIQIARRRKEQKSAEEYTAWARRLAPKIDLEITQKHFFTTGNTFSTDIILPSSSIEDRPYVDGAEVTGWNFALDLPLYRRPLSLTMKSAKMEYALASNMLTIKTRELDSRLHELLGSYLVATYQLHNLENSILISRDHVGKIQRGFDLRDQTKLALLRAQANLKELEARKELNEQRLERTFRRLLDFTAIPEESHEWVQLEQLLSNEEQIEECIKFFAALETSTETIKRFLADTMSSKQLQGFFVANSLLYKQITLERELGQITAKKYTQQEWPTLFVRGELERGVNTRTTDYSGEGSIGVVLQIPLFGGGTLFSTSKTRDLAAEIANIQEYSSTLRTFNSIADKKQTITSLQQVLQKQEIQLSQQQEIVRLSLQSYQIKRTTMQDLLTSKNRLIDAKNLLMRTTTDLGSLMRQFAWELGTPLPAPPVTERKPYIPRP